MKYADKQNRRINTAFYRARLNFRAPTISPGFKCAERNEIESIDPTLRFMKEKGIHSVVLQPKYMGSYCTMRLHRNLEASEFFSRNGYVISERIIPRKALIEAARPLHEKIFGEPQFAKLTHCWIGAELMPWRAMSQGLIEDEFGAYSACTEEYLATMLDMGMPDLNLETEDYQTYIQDCLSLSNKEVKGKYPPHVRRDYEARTALLEMNMDFAEYTRALNEFNRQLDIFGNTDMLSVEFKPFVAYKYRFADGNEIVCDNNLSFTGLSDDDMLLLNLDDIDVAIEAAYEYFNSLVAEDMEGIVIKPVLMWDLPEGCPPIFKVRNQNYLTMVYGIDFIPKFDRYFEKRKISKKMQCSINQWKAGQKMLQIPFDKLGDSSMFDLYSQLSWAHFHEKEIEETLDNKL